MNANELGAAARVSTDRVPEHPEDVSEPSTGHVEVFELHGHSGANLAYAWSYVVDEKTGRRKFHAVLGIPPINSAVDAVRASIAAEGQS